jgi:hypothetical protein
MIEFEQETHWDAEQIAVTLWAKRDDERIKCLVRGEALDERFGTTKNAPDRLDAFRDNRAMIEDRLRAKIENGRFERDPDGVVTWQVVLLPSDLE